MDTNICNFEHSMGPFEVRHEIQALYLFSRFDVYWIQMDRLTDKVYIFIDKGIFIPHSQAHKGSCSRKGRSDRRHKIFKQNININKKILYVPTIHMLTCKCKCLTLPTLLTINC